ncbi:MAG: ATP-binding cassette domain-containing protein [Thermoplasmatota archaeon]
MTKKAYVKLDNVSKSYNLFPALKNISFSIEKGDVFGYIGPNGAGKTTTIKALVGLITDFTGNIIINDMEMPDKKDEIHKILGYLPQNVSFQEWRTVEHALKTFGELSEVDKAELDDMIEYVLKIVGLEDSRYKKINQLSGGNVQKLGLAQALLHRPELLVFDEPLSGLDPASRYQVKQIIKELSKGATTILFSSHILSDVQDVATKIGIINYGEILEVGSLSQLKKEFSAPNIVNIEFFSEVGKDDSIRSLNGIEEVKWNTPNKIQVKISSDQPVEEISDKLLRKLLENGYKIRSFSPVSPNLDELYMKYVHREGQI